MNDRGSNTGGTGAHSIPWVTEAMMKQIGEKIFRPIIELMKELGMPFSGVLYAGLIWTADGPVVIEFNVRFGDPELMPLFIQCKTDLIPIMNAIAAGGSIANVKLEYKKHSFYDLRYATVEPHDFSKITPASSGPEDALYFCLP